MSTPNRVPRTPSSGAHVYAPDMDENGSSLLRSPMCYGLHKEFDYKTRSTTTKIFGLAFFVFIGSILLRYDAMTFFNSWFLMGDSLQFIAAWPLFHHSFLLSWMSNLTVNVQPPQYLEEMNYL